MARRKKIKGGELGVALALAFMALIKPILVVLVNVLTLVGLPSLFIFCLASHRKRKAVLANPANQVPDPSGFGWDEEKRRIHAISCAVNENEQSIKNLYSAAESMGLRRTEASNGKRLDQRQKESAEFNSHLDSLEAYENTLEDSRRREIKAVLRRVPAWRVGRDAIIEAESSCRASRLILFVYFFVFLVLLVIRPGWVQSLSSLAIEASSSFSVFFGPAALAAFSAWLAFLISRSKYRRVLDATINVAEAREWSKIEDEIRAAEYFDGAELVKDPTPDNKQSNESVDISEVRRAGREAGAKILRNLFENINKSVDQVDASSSSSPPAKEE